jgi:NADP-dependent 3-hydroxy acid dehydrogenase YdfG
MTRNDDKMNLLYNKNIMITGASAGIGKACAEIFAREGASLILAARRIDRLKRIAIEQQEKYGVSCYPLEMDVSNHKFVQNAYQTLPTQWKKIDILVNNAGMGRGMNPTYKDDPVGWEEMIDTNFKGMLYVIREVLPGMVDRKEGHLINVSSISGKNVYPGGGVYCSTKHAAQALTNTLRMELVDKNIRVTSVSPGVTETEFFEVRFYGDKEKAREFYKKTPKIYPEDVAETILFCATRPKHVNIHEITVTSSRQADVGLMSKERCLPQTNKFILS